MNDSVITTPLLPPMPGYVEVVDEDGNHVYKATPETEARLAKEEVARKIYADNQRIMGSILGEETPNQSTALEFHKAVQLFACALTDEAQVMQIASIYPAYEVGVKYKAKTDDHPADIFSYGINSVGDPQLYQVLQDHTSAEEWPPDTASSLYKKIGVSDEGIPIWVQPLGATDAYNTDDIVMYNGFKHISLIDANVWSPDAYPAGWKKIEESTEEPEEPDIPEWTQPTGAHDAYNTGDQVLYNGQVYESQIDGNTYAPDAYPDGWKLVETE